MPSNSSAPCTVPSSPWRPCSAMKQRTKPSRLSSTRSRSRGSKAWASTPTERSAASTPLPDSSEISRSAEVPPISTARLAERARVDRPPQPSWARTRGASCGTSRVEPLDELAGTAPIEPAPIAITTSPSCACSITACASSATSSTNTGSTWPATRSARASERPSAATIGCFARRVDLGQQHRIGLAEHLDEVFEAIARAAVAMRLERQHDALPGERAARGRQHRGHFHRVVAVVVDQREARRRRAPAGRRNAGSAGRRR